MNRIYILLTILIVISSCKSERTSPTEPVNEDPVFASMKVERYSVNKLYPDSISLGSYILRTYDSTGVETKSVYYSSDDSVMMQFANTYTEGNKTGISWINADDKVVRTVKNSFDDKGKLIRSETYNADGEFREGYVHTWKENGTVEEKAPLVEGEPIKANAIYFYHPNDDLKMLHEFDDNDSLYYILKYKYVAKDDNGNWTERQLYTNDTLTRLEKRIITYQ